MKTTLHLAHELGQSIWYDNIRRGLITSGELSRLVEQGVRGVTSNPTIFEKAISGSTDYDDALRRLVAESRTVDEIYDDLVIDDIRSACDVFRPIYDESGGVDGRVSIEVRPELASDTERTVSEAVRLHKAVGRDNLMVKIPATPEGMPAIRRALARGVSINVTLIFSVAQYEDVVEAFLSGLEDRVAAGGSIAHVASVASFFVSRVDTSVDALLAAKMKSGGPNAAVAEALLGRAAVANAKVAYARGKELFSTARWKALAGRGARPQRLLWGSTGTKNPRYRDTLYVDELIGSGTINTVPPATLAAFIEHGAVEPALERGHDEARADLARLASLGVDLGAVCDKLLADGVKAFTDSMTTLVKVIAARREALLEQAPARQRIALGTHATVVESEWAALAKANAVHRLWDKDPTLFTDDRGHDASIKSRLGWLASPDLMAGEVDELRALADELRADRFTDAVLLGMGGSSLCPEVLVNTHGTTPGALRLHVLDNTAPDAVAALDGALDLSRTLFVVASKSGGTIEIRSFERHFWKRVSDLVGDARAGRHFVAVTDPGTALGTLAREKGYRAVLENPADIGGRYSAVSLFGLVPAALIGMDVEALVDDAQRMAVACAAFVPVADNPGARLGGLIGALAKAGRDKLTFIASPEIASFGAWVEQLIAESTGKDGKGIVPVDLEPLGAPDAYGADRVFAYLRYGGPKPTPLDAQVDALEAAGQPVVRIGMLAERDLGGEFFRWEFATAIAGACLRENPFDEPNVAEAKAATAEALAAYQAQGALPRIDAADPGDAIVAAHLGEARAGDYVALCAYFVRDATRDSLLAEIRERVRARTRCATTLGYGPRFLHSTGQLHKGGPNTGVFLQLCADAPLDLPIPGEKYSFAKLRDAQAAGDFQVLQRRGRRVLRVNLGKDVAAGLRRLREALQKA